MKKYLLIIAVFVAIVARPLIAQQKKQLPDYIYKHMLSADEEKRNNEIGKSFIETPKPQYAPRNIAEFEPMSGVLVRYPFGIPLALIKSLAEEDTVITIVASASQETTVRVQYQTAGVDLNKCRFLHTSTDSYWTRDFGPVFIVDGNDEVGVVNFAYNRPRPNDDDVPMAFADFMGVEWYGMNVVHTGGNYMADGYGTAASTDIVYTESYDIGISQDSVDQRMLNYLGIDNYHVVDDPNNTYIDHIDCWGKFIDVDKIIIRSVPESHAQYNEIEQMAKYWMSQKTSWGSYYKVYRVYTPDDQPYSNSLILNGRVFVPQTGSTYDDDALEVYREAMPGYEILGFTGEWYSTDALHCRTHEVADKKMLQILHYPLFGHQEYTSAYTLNAEIKALSKKGLYEDSLKLNYRINGNEWNAEALSLVSEANYSATIGSFSEGDKIEYYIHAADSSGRSENKPYMGAQDPHVFYAGGNKPVLTLSHNEIIFDNSEEVKLTIENNFNEEIAILDVENELNYAVAELDEKISFPNYLDGGNSIVYNINPLIAIKNSDGYNVDTLRIMTIDSTYQVIIKCDESFAQSIENDLSIDIKAYPNPFNNKLNIEVTNIDGSEFQSAQIINISGQITEFLNPISVSENSLKFEWNAENGNKDISKGIYFIKIITDNRTHILKVIKK
jgi:agmatine deiminase